MFSFNTVTSKGSWSLCPPSPLKFSLHWRTLQVLTAGSTSLQALVLWAGCQQSGTSLASLHGLYLVTGNSCISNIVNEGVGQQVPPLFAMLSLTSSFLCSVSTEYKPPISLLKEMIGRRCFSFRRHSRTLSGPWFICTRDRGTSLSPGSEAPHPVLPLISISWVHRDWGWRWRWE